MTEDQWSAIQEYFDVRIQFLIDRSLGRNVFVSAWEAKNLEKKYADRIIDEKTPVDTHNANP